MSEYIVETVGEWGQYRDGEFVLEDEYMAVPATPIVRCRDCRCRRKSWNGKRPDFVPDGFFCAYWGGHQLWEPDGFCAWGKRREQ